MRAKAVLVRVEHVVDLVGAALFNRADFRANRNQRVAEAVEFCLRLALRRLDHQRARHRPRHRRRVETVVHHALCDVVDLDARRLVERTHVENELVRAKAVLVRVEHVVVALQARGHVVRVEDRDFGRALQALRAHHRDVHPRNHKDRRAAIWRGRNRANRVTTRRKRAAHWVTGEEVLEVRRDADRAHAGSAAAVRNAERLVQVEVADVGANVAWAREADLRVHVRAVHVDLSAVAVDDRARLLDAFFEDAVRRRVGDHERTEVLRVFLGLLREIREVDVSVTVALNRHDLHTCDHSRRRIRAVRRSWDEADVAVRFATVLVVRADDEHACVLTLRTRVWLQTHRSKAGRFAKPVLKRAEHFRVTEPLLARREWVNLAEFRPRHRNHLACRVQLHRA